MKKALMLISAGASMMVSISHAPAQTSPVSDSLQVFFNQPFIVPTFSASVTQAEEATAGITLLPFSGPGSLSGLLNNTAGITILVEAGTDVTALNALGLKVGQLNQLDALTLSMLSDAFGITSATNPVTNLPTTALGFVSDGDPGLLGTFGVPLSDILFVSENGTGFYDATRFLAPAAIDQQATFFSDPETSTVPDGGATVFLLGTAVAGLAALRRKMA